MTDMRHRTDTRRQHVASIGMPYSRICWGTEGVGTRVSPELASKHVLYMHDSCGMKWSAIARAAGVSRGTIDRLRRGTSGTVTVAVESAILNVRHIANRNLTVVPAIGLRRRIQALQMMGWAQATLAEAFSVSDTSSVRDWTRQDRVLWDTHERVRVFYESHCMTFGGSRRTASRAEQSGYAPPMAWLDIDDPDEQPMVIDHKRADKKDRKDGQIDWIAVELACRYELKMRQLTFIERREVVRILTDRGLSAELIAHKLHTTQRTVQRDREANLKDAR